MPKVYAAAGLCGGSPSGLACSLSRTDAHSWVGGALGCKHTPSDGLGEEQSGLCPRGVLSKGGGAQRLGRAGAQVPASGLRESSRR